MAAAATPSELLLLLRILECLGLFCQGRLSRNVSTGNPDPQVKASRCNVPQFMKSKQACFRIPGPWRKIQPCSRKPEKPQLTHSELRLWLDGFGGRFPASLVTLNPKPLNRKPLNPSTPKPLAVRPVSCRGQSRSPPM